VCTSSMCLGYSSVFPNTFARAHCRCPLHDCPFAHSEEEIAENEQVARFALGFFAY